MIQINLNNEDEVYSSLNLDPQDRIYFHRDTENMKVYEIVNNLLAPYGFEPFSENQFKRVAGGFVHSSNRIRNYASGRGKIINGYTICSNIIQYCQEVHTNSVFIPFENVLEEFNWAKRAINEGHITRYSGSGERYDIEAMIDIIKGSINEVALKIDLAINFRVSINLNREFYGISQTDEGQDIHRILINGEWIEPSIKIQCKDVQYFLLIPLREFDGPRSADIFIGYKAHWNKATAGQQFIRALGGRSEEIFTDFPPMEGIRVERRGWAKRDDFRRLRPGVAHKGQKFENDNMFVYWDDLRNLNSLDLSRMVS